MVRGASQLDQPAAHGCSAVLFAPDLGMTR
jgi:hypothetical protein